MMQPHSETPARPCLALPGPPPWSFQVSFPLFYRDKKPTRSASSITTADFLLTSHSGIIHLPSHMWEMDMDFVNPSTVLIFKKLYESETCPNNF